MKFKTVRSKLIDGIKIVQNIVGAKGARPILQNVLIESIDGAVRLTTSDFDLSIQTTVDCEIVEAGATTLPVKILFSMLAKAPEGEVEISVDADEQATIKAGSARYRLCGKPEAEFPKMGEEGEMSEYVITSAILREMLRKTSYAASQDDTRRTLKGVLMSFKDLKLTMVATDGRRLAMVENELEFPKNFERDIVLPSKTVQELMRILPQEGDVRLNVSATRMSVAIEQVKLSSKLIEDTYPNYAQVIPKNLEETIVIDRQLLLDAIERASVMTLNPANSIRLVFDMNKLVVMSSASNIGEAQDEVTIKYVGKKIEIVFNPNYLMDPLRAIDDDEITFNLHDEHSPAIIKCSIPFLYVIMPLRAD